MLMSNHWHFVVWPKRGQGELVTDFFRSLTMTHRLPFGTFLAPAIWITWVLERLMLQAF
jgi:prepilin signal peptidase PulO-like enzyme (type II secretory pathway)